MDGNTAEDTTSLDQKVWTVNFWQFPDRKYHASNFLVPSIFSVVLYLVVIETFVS